MKSRVLSRLYGLVVFLSAAILLVLEIVAGRLLAPYIGVSLYTWTSIIGIILAGLSLGHWMGGKLADHGAGHLTVGVVLIIASVSTLSVLPLLMMIGAVVQGHDLGLLDASFIYVLVLFFLPATAIGVLSPLLTTLALQLEHKPGSVVGRMHALSATGSILGTFVCGYWLIQWFGTRAIIGSCAAILFAMALPFLVDRTKGGMVLVSGTLAALLLILLTWHKNGFTSPCHVESNYYCLRVVNEQDALGQVWGRSLVIDHMIHGTNSRHDPGLLTVPYVQLMDTLIQLYFAKEPPNSFLFGGGGAYTLPRAVLHRDSDVTVSVSEIDPAVTDIARSQLFLYTSRMTIHHGNVRNLLRRAEEQSFEVIVTDVFHDIGIPWYLTTREFNRLVRRSLTDDGLYLINIIDVFPLNRLLQSILQTLQGTFPHIGIWIEKPPDNETRLTFVLSASSRPVPADTIQSISGTKRQWFNIVEFVSQQAREHEAISITDNYAPVERLLKKMLVTRSGN